MPCQTRLYTTEDGLSNKDVTAILQTANGYLWLGTANGLNRYNGYEFTPIDLPGLSNGKIKCLYEDKKGLLWIGTWEGLCILDQRTNRLKRLFQNPGSLGKVSNSIINCITGHPDGSVLVGTAEGELLKFKDPDSYRSVYKTSGKDTSLRHQLTAVTVGMDGEVWVVTDYGKVKRLDSAFKENQLFKSDVENINAVLCLSGSETVLLLDHWGHIAEVSGKTGRSVKRGLLDSANAKYKNITTGFMNQENELWTGYSSGAVLRTDFARQSVTDYSMELKSYITGAPRTICVDRTGLVWIGTNYGLVRLYPPKKIFENYLHSSPGSEVKDKKSIRGITETANGDIYIGGYSGLFKIKAGSGKPEQVRTTVNHVPVVNAYYPFRLVDDAGYLWIASEVKGFYRFNKKTSELEFPPNDPGGHKKKFVSSFGLMENGRDTIWIGTNNGLFIYQKKRALLSKFISPHAGLNISNVEITDLARNADARLWIGTRSTGLLKLSKDGLAETIKEVSGRLNFITCLYAENDSILWAGTRGNGVVRLNTGTLKGTFYTKKEGLADNSVASIIRDNEGNYWIATFNGLSRLNRHTGKFENYYERDGLTDNEFNMAACLKAKDGKIYLGGLNGLNAFYPGQIRKENKTRPSVFLTKLLTYSRRKNNLIEQSGDLADLKNFHFAVNDSYCSFTFSMNDYYNPLKNTYSYMLEGYDKGWNFIGTRNTIQFNGLPAGTYRLLVKGVNSEGLVTQNQLLYNITVSEIFYKTGWFLLLLCLFCILITYAIMRYKSSQKLKLQKLRTKISSDLHDEVGGLLTRISIQAELIKKGISGENATEEIGKIADTSRQATRAMNDVLWSIDARNDKIGSLIDRMREHAGEILFPLEIEVNFTVKGIDPEKEIDSVIRRNIFLIFKEAVNNIAKHSGASTASILIEKRQEELILIMEDDGKENKKSKPGNGQGLSNMKMRAHAINGELNIVSRQGYKLLLNIKKFSWA